MEKQKEQLRVNDAIPGRHFLGKLDALLVTQPELAPAIERVGARFWQKGMSIQNAINKESQLVGVFQKAAEGDPSYMITNPKDFPGQAGSIFKHYQEKGLKAFGNP